MITDKFKNLVERKIEDLRQYKQSPNFKESVLNTRMAEINTMIDFYNFHEVVIKKIEDERDVLGWKLIHAEQENENLKKFASTRKLYISSDGFLFDMTDIPNKKVTKPSENYHLLKREKIIWPKLENGKN